MPMPPPHGILNPLITWCHVVLEAHWKCLSFKKILQMWNSYVNLFPGLHSEWFKWESFPLALNPMPLTENEFLCALADFPWYTQLCLAKAQAPSFHNPPRGTGLSAGLPTILFSHQNTFRETRYLGNAVHAHLIREPLNSNKEVLFKSRQKKIIKATIRVSRPKKVPFMSFFPFLVFPLEIKGGIIGGILERGQF